MNAPLSAAQQETAYLSRLGERVRAWRGSRRITRKALAQSSGVSERYLAQLEALAASLLLPSTSSSFVTSWNPVSIAVA